MGQKSVDKPKETVYTHRNQRVVIPDGFLAVGLIVGVHGLRGEVKVEIHTDFPERFDAGNTLYFTDALKEVPIKNSRPHKGHMLLQFAGVKDRGQAEALRQTWLFVPEDDAKPLGDDMYWVHDLIGMTVIQVEADSNKPVENSSETILDDAVSGTELGTITDVLETGANDVYVIKPFGSINRGRELLLPAIADVVQKVDVENQQMFVQLQPGLLEE